MFESEVADDLVEALPKSGLTGKPPTVEDGVKVLENVLNGVLLEPKAEPPVVPALIAKPPLPVSVLFEEVESAAKPPVDEAAAADPKVDPENPNVAAGFLGTFAGVGVAVPPPSDEVVPKADDAVPPSDEVVPKADDVVPPSDEVVPKADDAVAPSDEVVPKADDAVPPSDDVVPKADDVVPPSDEVAPKIDGDVVSPAFLPNAENGEEPVGGLPNVSPLEPPEPKAEGEPKPEPNAVDPVAPNERVDFLAAEFAVVSWASSFDDEIPDADVDPLELLKPTEDSGFAGVSASSIALFLFSSTTTHEALSGVEAPLADGLVIISSGSLGKFATDPKAGPEK